MVMARFPPKIYSMSALRSSEMTKGDKTSVTQIAEKAMTRRLQYIPKYLVLWYGNRKERLKATS
jgi:hypothetical protein